MICYISTSFLTLNNFPNLKKDEIIFACVGTDRSTGDSFGPIVGTSLKSLGYHVVGTLEKPLHAENLKERVDGEILPDKFVIAIDAVVGRPDSVGDIIAKMAPLYPGKGVGKDLGRVGDAVIKGVVCTSSSDISSVRLYSVMEMAKITVQAICEKYPD